MTDPKDLPPDVRRHMDRQRQHQSQPIPTDRPTLDEMTSGPAWKRARILRRMMAAGDDEGAKRIQAMTDAEILKLTES